MTRKCKAILRNDYLIYPQSAENICYSRFVAPNRNTASHNRRSNSCGRSSPNRCSIRVGSVTMVILPDTNAMNGPGRSLMPTVPMLSRDVYLVLAMVDLV
ncbi:uncharacterized protein EV420DRAFT_1583623 [Desarmillaria tabescens]|uniref:Uncharacterized protein n=1 Tax=Armillaria tabescens TaxID=1929756 RepID=A0AA39MLR9_ARMTA|nr:uncharacterized protein EV420DRAFT_1583623 [Desarmillaria tabescens]KAK0439516.1 hypothetical protein EV420DRAFT_1583623 [Desarmillaria tabescens]